jgi:hypothetical protein
MKRVLKRVESVGQLKKLVKAGKHGYFINLNFGCVSSKEIYFEKNKFLIENMIDGSGQKLTSKQIMSRKYTNIGEAIQKKAFFCFPEE